MSRDTMEPQLAKHIVNDMKLSDCGNDDVACYMTIPALDNK